MSTIDAVAKLNGYIAAFNARDLKAIEAELHPDVAVAVNGTVAVTGRHAILPSYQQDFDKGKVVSIVKGPAIVDIASRSDDRKDDTIAVDVTLLSEVAEPFEHVVLDVRYHYSKADHVQVLHEISNIVSQDKPSSSK